MDLIERHVALNAVDAIGHIATMPDGDKCIRRSAVKYTLSMLPSAQPERKTGAWMPYDTIPRYVICRCSACGTDILVPCINDKTIFNYCPNCGAKMEEKQYE